MYLILHPIYPWGLFFSTVHFEYHNRISGYMLISHCILIRSIHQYFIIIILRLWSNIQKMLLINNIIDIALIYSSFWGFHGYKQTTPHNFVSFITYY